MKLELALLAILALTGTTLFFQENQSQNLYQQYTQWKSQYGKNVNDLEDSYRFAIWTENYFEVEKINAQENNFILGMTIFADLTNEEFRSIYTRGYKSSKKTIQSKNKTFDPINEDIDWVQKGAVTPVQNQGSCGSCWAFSAVSSLNSLYEINHGTLIAFSEQQVTSCTPGPDTDGCNGGEMTDAFTYSASAGLETQADYPYTQGGLFDKTHPCEYNETKAIQNINTGYKNVPANSPNDLLTALESQPVSIAIDAASIVFQLYLGGIIDKASCGTNLNHGVALVGYYANAEENLPYWLVKNSWGVGWGNKGYVNIAVSDNEGYCGVNMDPSYPVSN